ncbi:MAG: hypothetical protein JJ861_13440 [Rhizobiales bacterium]|nr:hypothetical protein [Hyphomicrobiales bacterium]MBO6699955.1 hypothetical protein [Hyphomicrobiales bacterium]MBO6913063.1 hypothetical protein [Hyphomicrobiales bacterium]
MIPVNHQLLALAGIFLLLTGLISWVWEAALVGYVDVFLGAALFQIIC